MKTKNKSGFLTLDRTKLIIILWIIIFLTFPNGVICGFKDMIETTSSFILIILLLFMLCTLIGYLSRRISGEGLQKSGNSIFK